MYLDIAVLILLVLSLFDGLKNGIFVEFLSVFGLVINFYIAKFLTPFVMAFLKYDPSDNKYFIIYIIVFWIVYVVLGLMLHLFRNMMDTKNKGLLNRFLGGVLGISKGLILAMILLFIFNYISETNKKVARYGNNSIAKEKFSDVLPVVEDYFPEVFKEKLNSIKNTQLVDRSIKKYL